ncbi:bifunctional phosphoribosylaminoimidazolecarboxamide formyltransferase/IMP cyclohydrolase [Acetobacterium tundrae]|uniref:Bifunctional purine biosynthesis protein PurH n=1 Tax=Acetobacterium tundrae TaxID=132932 RepID=A0ABR6WJI7_9FIRM|nr:bifunctional phosphoribosylaminoimidazolecarboxamide formyltransferase/IMP cyclohydrolase [Acetobacterium tundrae]MBC3796650.1 bifunctional phosphoribosylaminoimidazolecarboxamide formyltransferase/IMP cyclohydrolase [Acetobacterium tundrae]
MRALLSVSDKNGIVEFAQKLADMGWEILSTGGTAKTLREAGLSIIGVSEVTGFPECLDGRVKTLHPKIHGGILGIRNNPSHQKQMKDLDITPIDLLVINLYPFKNTILKEGVVFEEAIENIDIGGPTMLRSAAKNFNDVTVVVDPDDYAIVLSELEADGKTTFETRYNLALKVFETTSNYDTMIADYLKKRVAGEVLNDTITMTFEKVQDMRYGENPHQKAAFYGEVVLVKGALTSAKQLQGKELSYNNINDTNGALEILKEYGNEEPTIVAVKHANPCGIASDPEIAVAYQKAYESDPVSIYGGIIASNRVIDETTAKQMVEIFLEIIVAPGFSKEALKILAAKKNLRLLELEEITYSEPGYEMKKVLGGLLVQERDTQLYEELKVVTNRKPTPEEMEDLLFAWKAVKNTKSNAISITKEKCLIGNGPGQVNRIGALEIAIGQAGDKVKGSVMGSDAFFPYDDCVKAAAAAGITAIIQPGGAGRDEDSIKACDVAGIAMIFTGMRHFKH